MNNLDALFQNIIDNPDDNTVRLVYADALDERGQGDDAERAEYIRGSIAVTQTCFRCLGAKFSWFVPEFRGVAGFFMDGAGPARSDSHFRPCPDCNADNYAGIDFGDPEQLRVKSSQVVTDYNDLRERISVILNSHPDWKTHPCAACGGDGYFKGPRLGDERCEECLGEGNLLTRYEALVSAATDDAPQVVMRLQSREPKFARGFITTVNCWLPEFSRMSSLQCDDCGGSGSVVHDPGDVDAPCLRCFQTGRVVIFAPDTWPSVMVQKYPLSHFRLMGYHPHNTLSGGAGWRRPDDSGELRMPVLAETSDVLPEWLFDRVGRYHSSTGAATKKLDYTLCRLVRESVARIERDRLAEESRKQSQAKDGSA